eukprot:COSAG05_NODE_1962_length_3773_cov_127.334194_2_plen_52_part_00
MTWVAQLRIHRQDLLEGPHRTRAPRPLRLKAQRHEFVVEPPLRHLRPDAGF